MSGAERQRAAEMLEQLRHEFDAEYVANPQADIFDTSIWPDHFPRLCALSRAIGDIEGWLSHETPRLSFAEAVQPFAALLPA